MCDKDLPPAHNLRHRDALVFLPILHRLFGVNEDYKIVILALQVHLGLACVSAHCDGLKWGLICDCWINSSRKRLWYCTIGYEFVCLVRRESLTRMFKNSRAWSRAAGNLHEVTSRSYTGVSAGDVTLGHVREHPLPSGTRVKIALIFLGCLSG